MKLRLRIDWDLIGACIGAVLIATAAWQLINAVFG